MTGNKVIQTAPITPARVRVFQPSIRPVQLNGEWIETSWGRCRVTGRLGQRHADMLEAVLFCAERRKNEDAGTVKLLVDPSKVRQVMSQSRYSLEQCWTLLRELRACTIEIETPRMRIMGGVVESAEYTKTETRRDPLTGEQRRLWTVRLGKAWAELMRLDMTSSHDPAPICRLQHGITKSVARFILTHSANRQPNGGWNLDTLILAVAGEMDSNGMKNARRRLFEEADALRGMGIKIGGGRAHLVSQPPDVVSQPPGGVTAAHVSLGSSGFSA